MLSRRRFAISPSNDAKLIQEPESAMSVLSPRIKKLLPLAACLALFGLFLQVSALGHWSLGPIKAETGDLAAHAAHCHGNTSACADLSSPPPSSIMPDSPIPTPPPARLHLQLSHLSNPLDYRAPVAEKPPRSA